MVPAIDKNIVTSNMGRRLWFNLVYGVKAMLAVLLACTWITVTGATLYCYSCVGTHPGCGLSTFRYAWNQGKPCPRYNDRCVKLIEQRGADVLVTRDCLSHFEGHRVDIPADKYEGCRQASRDVKLGQHTFNRIKELDTKRTFFQNTTWCFCMLDDRCNIATHLNYSTSMVLCCSILVQLVVVNHQIHI